MRRVVLLYIFANHCNVWLNRKQLISHACFCSQSIVMCFIRKKLWLHVDNCKGRRILVAFSDKCEYSLMLHQNLISSSFLKFSCNMESEILSVNFLRSGKLWKGLGDSQKSTDHTLKVTCYKVMKKNKLKKKRKRKNKLLLQLSWVNFTGWSEVRHKIIATVQL